MLKSRLAGLGELYEPDGPKPGEAEENANNVVANRVAEFVDYHAEELQRMLQVWELKKGLTSYDTACLFERLRGNPKPIVIAPEPEIDPLDFFGEDDLADMAEADAEIDGEEE